MGSGITEFHARYSALAFPGGIPACFLRSRYMFKDILRMCARAPLTADQASRFKVLSGNVDEWRTRKLSTHE
jgi:hypothetical protein